MKRETHFKSPAGEKTVMALYDDLLRRWPVSYNTHTVQTGIGATFVIACGDLATRPLLLLHGAGSNATMWIGDIAAYSAQYRVYAVDLPGEPGKSTPVRPAYNGPAYAEWLRDVLDELQIDSTAIVGISQGGWAALKFATTYPQRVNQLATIAPAGVVPNRKSFLPRALLLMLLGNWGLERLTRLLYGDEPVPEGVSEVMAVLMGNFNARRDAAPLFSDDELKQLTMPVFLAGGSKDIIFDNTASAARMQKLLPHFTANIVPGAGHTLLPTDSILAWMQDERKMAPV